MARAHASAQAEKGERVGLVRYVPGREGWRAELIEGEYLGRDAHEWRLAVEGTPHTYPRDQWELCRP